MTLFEALLYGLVQGITEYLPISSSAHLILLPRFLGRPDPGLAFDVFLHIGTLGATLVYFWRDWIALLRKKTSDAQLSKILLATLPALVIGALVHDWAETVFRSNSVLIVTLPVAGFFLVAVDRYRASAQPLKTLSMRGALFVGFFQSLALIPGVSRSGSTITAGRLLGLSRDAAAKFSFLISAPITAAAILYKLKDFEALSESIGAASGSDPFVLWVAAGSSFVFGILAIGGLLRLLRRFGFLSFAIYRVLLAIAIAFAWP